MASIADAKQKQMAAITPQPSGNLFHGPSWAHPLGERTIDIRGGGMDTSQPVPGPTATPPTTTSKPKIPLSTPPPYPTPQPTKTVQPKKIPVQSPTPENTINGYNLGDYATAPGHVKDVKNLYASMSKIGSAQDVQAEINKTSKIKNKKVPISGEMVWKSAMDYGVDPILMMAIMQKDSNLGTEGIGARSRNPGNVGTDDTGHVQKFKTWQDGVNALAYDLAQRKLGNNSLTYNK